MQHYSNRTMAPHLFLWKSALALLLVALGLLSLPANSDLIKEQEEILKQHPNVAHISANQLENLLNDTPEQIVLFDVREKPEFEVSHIKGSIQIDPEMTGQEFLGRYGDSIQNRKVIFYCSVGYRSSNMAENFLNQSSNHSSMDVVNLRYGLFGWHNQERGLVRGNTSTDLIHPYNFWWGRLIERSELTSYKP